MEPNQESLKVYRDLKNVIDTARDDGEKKKAFEIARNLLNAGLPLDFVAENTGLSKEEVVTLQP
ncbi:MAG: hypothetical protein SF097_18040 [Acidobacteriota bacterium]|nr:hypothetical protein [Acidobacteriota bacterium]